MKTFDIIIIGAGAAGLFVAERATNKNKSTLVIDMGSTPARKVAISGGGKCNFTNLRADHKHYFGNNPDFTRGALARWTPTDTLNWIKSNNIKYHEKTPGQYFAESATDIVDMLLNNAKGTTFELNTNVQTVEKIDDKFIIKCDNNKTFATTKLIIATGGISYTNMGTSDIGYKIAKQFGHKIIPPRPGLCAIATKNFDSHLSGISLPVEITIGKEKILDTMLFTHFGIGGPAIYKTSVRNLENGFTINLIPDTDVFNWLKTMKRTNGKKQIKTILATKLPDRVADFFANNNTSNIADWRDTELLNLTNKITKIRPDKFTLHNFQSAEVTSGGVDTAYISSKTMESKLCENLYFIGEVLDITGDLGGYNLQWAWASANAVEI